MGFLIALLVLAAVDFSLQYSLEPQLAWPEEYHFNAEEIDLDTTIVKSFEIWYSTEHNRSRIDLYGGTVSRFYYGPETEDGDGKVYMIHPEVAEDDSGTVIKCEEMTSWGDQEDFLPDLYDFEYSGTVEHDGKQVQKWTRVEELENAVQKDEVLLVMDIDGDVGIPLHHDTKMWNLKDGSLKGHTVINYYNYDDNVTPDVLDAEEHEQCGDWDKFTDDFHDAVKVLHPTIRSDLDMAFHRFKIHHNRDYEETEHRIRRAIFKHNWNLVLNHNEKKLSYKLGLNQFADKTFSELSYLNGIKGKATNSIQGTHPFPHSEEELASMVEDFPKDFDLRSLGVVSPVRNQAHCGSCWAFAMAATLEGVLARNNGGRLIDLSEQSLVDCAWAFKGHGCQGAEGIGGVYDYVLKHGIPTVKEYGPYLEEDGYCKIDNMTKLYTIKGFSGVTKNSENALKAAIYNNGPVTIAILVTEKMMFYRSGVFYDKDCPPDPDYVNHAVTLVGYGERDGDLYWIVKNSWGQAWGESGYVLMKADNNNCNVMTTPYYPIL